MKRTFLILVMLFAGFCLFAFDYAQYMIGYVGTVSEFFFEMDQSVLPINLDSPDVRVSPGATPRGKKIGTYTFITNSPIYTLYVAHTPLQLQGSETISGRITSMDYRLYLFLSDSRYESCLSSPAAENPKNVTDTTRVVTVNGTSGFKAINKSVYVNLEVGADEDIEEILGKLHPGTYSSTIYFLLEGQ